MRQPFSLTAFEWRFILVKNFAPTPQQKIGHGPAPCCYIVPSIFKIYVLNICVCIAFHFLIHQSTPAYHQLNQ